MNRTLEERLRARLGQQVPDDGSDGDTAFSDDEIEDLLEEAHQDLNAATYYGWRELAGHYAHLVTVSEGNALREMTELHAHALRMMRMYEGYVPTPGRGRARIGTIVRETG